MTFEGTVSYTTHKNHAGTNDSGIFHTRSNRNLHQAQNLAGTIVNGHFVALPTELLARKLGWTRTSDLRLNNGVTVHYAKHGMNILHAMCARQ